jgi:hypothetical protein
VQRCRGGAEEVQRKKCRGSEEVQRRCREGAEEVQRRWKGEKVKR